MNTAQRLQALGHARQRQAYRQAQSAAAVADRAILNVWRHVLDLLAQRRSWFETQHRVRSLFAGLLPTVREHLSFRLHVIGDWGWRSAVYVLRQSLSKETLARAFAGQNGKAGVRAGLPGNRPGGSVDAGFLSSDGHSLFEEEERGNQLAFSDLIDLLFPPPEGDTVHRIVFGGDWQARLHSLCRLASPWELAGIVGAGLAAGKDHREIARELEPLVNRVRSSARRIARTEALRVAGAMQMQAHKQLGDLVIGFQVFSAHVSDSRSWHVARSGTVYYKNPAPGQKGMAQCPHPPDEAQDPTERPPRTPSTAPNCLCFLVPVLRD